MVEGITGKGIIGDGVGSMEPLGGSVVELGLGESLGGSEGGLGSVRSLGGSEVFCSSAWYMY